MSQWKVADISLHLEKTGDSPEKFAKQIQLSNMTIRRWLKKPMDFEIPEKYHPLLDRHFHGKTVETTQNHEIPEWMTARSQQFGANYTEMVSTLQNNGESVPEEQSVYQAVETKLTEKGIDQVLRDYASQVMALIKSGNLIKSAKAICLGSLLYLVDPMDLVPDAIPILGYLDDMAVLSMAMQWAHKK